MEPHSTFTKIETHRYSSSLHKPLDLKWISVEYDASMLLS